MTLERLLLRFYLRSCLTPLLICLPSETQVVLDTYLSQLLCTENGNSSLVHSMGDLSKLLSLCISSFSDQTPDFPPSIVWASHLLLVVRPCGGQCSLPPALDLGACVCECLQRPLDH